MGVPKPTKPYNLPRIEISQSERLWLEQAYAYWRRGKPANRRAITVTLWDKLAKDFDPDGIDSWLMEVGDNLTLLGIYHADPETDAVEKCDLVIQAVIDRIRNHPREKKISAAEIARTTKIMESQVSRIFVLLGFPWGHFWSGASGRPEDGFTDITVNDSCLKKYHAYNGIEKLIWSGFEKRTVLREESFGEDRSQVVTGPWAPRTFRLFMSHVSDEKVFVSEVKNELSQLGIDAFVAHEDIEPTKEWEQEIEHALETSDALAAFLSSGFKKSSWTDQEVGYCVRRRVLILPIRRGLDPYGFISRYQALPGRRKTAQKLAHGIFEVLVEHDLTAEKMADAIVWHFIQSDSFADANRNVRLLKAVKSWNPQRLREIEEAVAKNSQLRGANDVPRRINRIVAEHRA